MSELQQRLCQHCGKPLALTLDEAADGKHCWRSAERCKPLAPLEAQLAERDKLIAELETERRVTADWVDQNLSDMQVYEYRQALLIALPQRMQDGDSGSSKGEDGDGKP